MSIISDFIIAPHGSGQEVGLSINPSDQWSTLQAKGVETVKLATLHCAITGRTYTKELQRSFLMVGGDQEEGPWVFECPGGVVQSFANIEPSQLASIADKWASTDELRMDGWSATDAADFISALSKQAKAAIASGHAMYLWLAL